MNKNNYFIQLDPVVLDNSPNAFNRDFYLITVIKLLYNFVKYITM